MKLNIYQIDAFTNSVFMGNPACVVQLETWLPKETLLNIAKENAVAETAFFIMDSNSIKLRWFTPEIEMDLCGHATLATAHCIKSILNYSSDTIEFDTASGLLKVTYKEDMYYMDFPSRMPTIAKLPEPILQSLNIKPKAVFKSRDYVLLYENQQEIESIKIERTLFDQLNIDPGGVVVTAKGDYCDFVSRFFTPQASILEDPVTGSAHCSLIPFWAEKLGKQKMLAYQISERKGELVCQNLKNRVLIAGKAITYMKGEILVKNF